MKIQALALAFLAATAIGGIAWVFIYPYLSGEKKAESRRASVAKPEPAARQADKTQRSRREQVEGSLKDLEARRQKEKSIPLSVRLTQAGLRLDDAEILDHLRHPRGRRLWSGDRPAAADCSGPRAFRSPRASACRAGA